MGRLAATSSGDDGMGTRGVVASLWLVVAGCAADLGRESGEWGSGLEGLGTATSAGSDEGSDDERGSSGGMGGPEDDSSTSSPGASTDDGVDETTTGGGPPLPPANADYCEIDGMVVVEAEHFASNEGYAEVARPDASGGIVMQVGDQGSLDLSIHFDTAGEVFVWLRTFVPIQDSENNGVFLDLDGEPLVAPAGHPFAGVPDIYLQKIGWAWAPAWQGNGAVQGPVTFMVTPGDHTLTIRKRLIERPEIDKIVLDFAGLEPNGLGPGETPCR